MKHILLFIVLIFTPAASHAGDHTELFEKISIMAKEGDAEAAYHLGMLYNNGIGTQQNIEEAYKWFLKSAAGDDPLGAYKLGCYYGGQAGDVVEYDKEKALHYKLIAAKSGYTRAQYDVGFMLVKKEETETGIHYFTLAAKQGHVPSLQVLAYLHEQGTAIKKDLARAYAYISLADIVRFGDRKPKTMIKLGMMKSEMTEKQIALGKRIIAEWIVDETPLTTMAYDGLNRSYEHAGLPLPE